MGSWVRPDGDGSLVDVWVVPGSSRDAVDGPHGDALKVRVTAPPERGRANRAVVDLLESLLESPVELIGGGTGRRKRVRVTGLPPDTVSRLLDGGRGRDRLR